MSAMTSLLIRSGTGSNLSSLTRLQGTGVLLKSLELFWIYADL